jgi:hypothetical protein
MTKPEIEERRKQLAEDFLGLPDAWSTRGLEICEEFGRLVEEEDYLNRSGSSDRVTTE